jgi:hypothetical protein
MKRFTAVFAGLALVLGLAAPPAFTDETQESDDAGARNAWQAYWFNERENPPTTQAEHGRGQNRKHVFPRQYKQFLMGAAARERERYPALMPAGESPAALEPEAAVAALGTTWVNIGPTKADYIQNGSFTLNKTDAGRPVAVVTHPTDAAVLYVAFSGGGVWKTTNGGANWTAKTETLGSLSCGSLVMDPNNASVLYLGLGDAFDGTGIGLMKSSNGGDTWTGPVLLGDSSVIKALFVAPTNSNVVLAATDKGLYRSTDAGGSFSKVAIATGQAGDPFVWSLGWGGSVAGSDVVSLTLETRDAAGTTLDGQIWRSVDSGATWNRTFLGAVGRMTLAVAPSNRDVQYALAAVINGATSSDLQDIYKSTNNGASWVGTAAAKKRYTNGNREARTLATLLNGQGWYDQLAIVHPTNPSNVFFGGALVLARTTDGGSKYTQMSNWLAQFGLPYVHADFHAGAYAADGALYLGTDGGIFKSTDNGASWSDALNVGITTHLLYTLGSSPNVPSAVIGGFQDNGTRVRSGASSIYNQEIGGDGFGSHIHQVNGNTMLGSLYYARIDKSTNGGLDFVAASTGISESNNSSTAPFNTKIVPWTGDPAGNTVFTHANAKVYKSTNYGGSWSALGTTGLSEFIRNINVAKSNVNVLGAVASGGRVFLSNNGGPSWTLATAPPNNDLSMSYVHFDINDPNIVYVSSVAAKGTANHLWKSTNFGVSWTAIDGGGFPTGVPVNCVIGDPLDAATLYAGTHLGVYRSSDSGATWTRFGAGLPLVNVTDIYVSPSSSLVRAATYGRGFWELQP